MAKNRQSQDGGAASAGLQARFRTTLRKAGKSATGIVVPPEVIAGLARGHRPAVRVSIGEHSYRSTVGVMDGVHMVSVSAANRAAAGIEAGDEIDVLLEVDDAPREVTLPEDFGAALAAVPHAKAFFAGLSYSQKRWHVLTIEDAKRPETRRRRIDRSVSLLADGRAR